LQIGENTDPVSAGHRLPALDGVRGLAIALVLMHHSVIWSGIDNQIRIDSYVRMFANSLWLGVDLFFVLSGFLITAILYDSKGSDRYFRSFYGRRALRILPLYYGFLVFFLLFARQWLPAESARQLLDTQGWYWLFLSNVQVALNGWQEPVHLGHFWSLAVEEQFYLLWPFAVWMLSRTALVRLAGLFFALALLIRVFKPFDMTALGAYVLLPTRMDAIAAGAYVALMTRGVTKASPESKIVIRRAVVVLVVCATALALIYAVHRGLPELQPAVNTVGFTLIASACASMLTLLILTPSGNWLNRLFAGPPLMALGRYSYGLYVVHVPIILFLMDRGLDAKLFPRILGSTLPGVGAFCVVAVALSLAVAVLSFHLFESPILSLKRYLPYRANGYLRDDLQAARVPGIPVKSEEVTVMVNGKSRPRYRGAEVIAAANTCNAARSLQNVRLLSAEVPLLPLKNCDHPLACQCIYRRFEDRRHGSRRENDGALVALALKTSERRRGLGRRRSDYA
jgi:peptidoglycan/LPS O-acetylase OafA/YrhL